jgi:hypothetical protein
MLKCTVLLLSLYCQTTTCTIRVISIYGPEILKYKKVPSLKTLKTKILKGVILQVYIIIAVMTVLYCPYNT